MLLFDFMNSKEYCIFMSWQKNIKTSKVTKLIRQILNANCLWFRCILLHYGEIKINVYKLRLCFVYPKYLFYLSLFLFLQVFSVCIFLKKSIYDLDAYYYSHYGELKINVYKLILCFVYSKYFWYVSLTNWQFLDKQRWSVTFLLHSSLKEFHKNLKKITSIWHFL